MAYYMRYITSNLDPIQFDALGAYLYGIDQEYRYFVDDFDEQSAELIYKGERIATLEINARGDQLFDEDIEDLIELLTFITDSRTEEIINQLKSAQAMLVAAVYWPGDDPEPVFSLLDPLWDWLFANRPGLLQADNEGFYDVDHLILEMRTKI